MTIDITELTFEQTIGHGIVVIDCWAAWCGPCRAFAPVFERVAASYPDIVFGKIDIDAEPGLAGALEITSIPTLMVFRDGLLVYARPGALAEPTLVRLIGAVRELDMDEFRRRMTATERSAG
jgi:thioredoxin 1